MFDLNINETYYYFPIIAKQYCYAFNVNVGLKYAA